MLKSDHILKNIVSTFISSNYLINKDLPKLLGYQEWEHARAAFLSVGQLPKT